MSDSNQNRRLPAVPGHCFQTSWFWRAMPAGMRRRWWMFRSMDLIARLWPVFKRRRGLLVVRMDGIGDMVLFRNALDHYAEVFGVAQEDVTVLGCESWASVAGVIFAGYRVIAINEHAYARRPFYRFKISLWVRSLAPAITVCDSYLRRALMADSLAWVSGAPRTVVSLPYINEPTRAEFTYYLSQVNEIIKTGDYPTHEVIRHFRFVSTVAGREIPPLPPKIAWRDNKGPIDEGAPYVVLNPGSNEPGRRWPLAGYLNIAQRLLKQGFRVVFVGTHEEKPDEEKMRALQGKPGVINLIGRTSLPELLDLMNHAAGMISNDTGPAHLGIALGAPILVIVGGGHFGSFVPYPKDITPANARFIFHEMDCYHCFWRCHKRQSKFHVFPCIDAISEDRVWREIEGLLKAGRKAA